MESHLLIGKPNISEKLVLCKSLNTVQASKINIRRETSSGGHQREGQPGNLLWSEMKGWSVIL